VAKSDEEEGPTKVHDDSDTGGEFVEQDAASSTVEAPHEGAWFLDLERPLLSQLVMSKRAYLVGIQSPAFPTTICRLFGFWPVEMLSRTPWWIIPLVWLPVICLIIAKAFEQWPSWSVHMLSAAGVPELVQVPVTDVVHKKSIRVAPSGLCS
jgi:hypothetical protein